MPMEKDYYAYGERKIIEMKTERNRIVYELLKRAHESYLNLKRMASPARNKKNRA